MRIICCIYEDFVRQLKAFLPSFCHLCACEMSPGWGHLITWINPSVGHLNGILARVLIFKKVKYPGGCPGGGDVEASIWPIQNGCLATQFSRFTLWHNGRRASQLEGKFTLWHNGRRAKKNTVWCMHQESRAFSKEKYEGLIQSKTLLRL